MESVFNDHVFPKYMSQQVMKPQMDGFSDPTLRNFSLLDLSALMKDELKADRFDDEFIQSFLNAAKELAAAGRRAIDRPGMYVMLEHSYAIPVMFLTVLRIKVVSMLGVGAKKRCQLLDPFPVCRKNPGILRHSEFFITALFCLFQESDHHIFRFRISDKVFQDRNCRRFVTEIKTQLVKLF